MALSKKIILYLFSFLMLAGGDATAGISLMESFESALLNNQQESINRSRVDQANFLERQARGDYLPTISARGIYQKQDQIDAQTSMGINLTHSLYRGGRDRMEIIGANISREMAENQKSAGRIELYINVIQAYYNYLLNWNDQKNLELLKKQSKDRTEEIIKRVQIGRSRRGEQMQAEAQLSLVLAQSINGMGLLKESEERFYVLTGLVRSKVFESADGIDQWHISEEKTFDEYLNLALQRADVKNRELAISQSEQSVKIAKGGHLPTLDLTSNYYLHKTGGTALSRKSDWDVGLTLNFPIFEGGKTDAKIGETVAKKQEAIYMLSDFQKQLTLELTAKYQNFRRLGEQIAAYEQAMEKTKNSYNETLKDYRLGLVSNLDVLTSLNLYLDSKRNVEKTKIQAMMNQKILEATAGILP